MSPTYAGVNGQEWKQATAWGRPTHTDRLKSSGSYFLLSTPLGAAFVNQLRAASYWYGHFAFSSHFEVCLFDGCVRNHLDTSDRRHQAEDMTRFWEILIPQKRWHGLLSKTQQALCDRAPKSLFSLVVFEGWREGFCLKGEKENFPKAKAHQVVKALNRHLLTPCPNLPNLTSLFFLARTPC